jgi:hypothetical protein
MVETYKKSILATNWYHATITTTKLSEDEIGICFTVDTGQHAYRNIWCYYKLDDFDLSRMSRLFSEVGYHIITDPQNPIFSEQFIKLRFNASIGRRIKDKFIVNEILELKLPEEDPSFDVTKERTDEHFYDKSKKRKLPIL